MVEIGTSAPPWRASAIAVGAALAAEADGAHAIWFSADLPFTPDRTTWPRHAGPLAGVTPDPTDVADPVVTASAALLVVRRARIGILGWDPGPDAARGARTVASLADLAPDRAVVAVVPGRCDALAAALRPGLAVELVTYGGEPEVASAGGWGWIGVAEAPADLAKAAAAAGVIGTLGVHLPVVVHADAAVARAATGAGMLAAAGFDAAAPGVVVGDPATLGAVIDEYVAAGVERIVLDDLLPFGDPSELEGARAAVLGAIRSARLRHRETRADDHRSERP